MHSAFSSFKKSTAIAWLWLSVNAFAGHSIGNGGSLLVCKSSSGISYESLDYFDALAIGAVDLGPATLSLQEKVQYALKKLERLDFVYSNKLRLWATQFSREARFVDDQDIPVIADQGGILYPEECHFEQGIFQLANPKPNAPRYLVASQRWNKLDDVNRAALVLHEVVYRDGIERGQTDSLSSRNFVRILLTGKLDSASEEDFRNYKLNNFFDEYQFRIPTNEGRIYLRFFDTHFFKYAEAVEFCENLHSNGRLLSREEMVHFIPKSNNAIKLRLQILSHGKDLMLWVGGSPPQIYDPLARHGRVEPGDQLYSFICYQKADRHH